MIHACYIVIRAVGLLAKRDQTFASIGCHNSVIIHPPLSNGHWANGADIQTSPVAPLAKLEEESTKPGGQSWRSTKPSD